MPVTLWRRDNGKSHVFEFSIDAREALAAGDAFTTDRPREPSEKTEEFSEKDLSVIAELAEKERLGSSLVKIEREKLDEYRALEEKLSPAEPTAVPAPQPTEVEDTFSPATASRDELFVWLRDHNDQAPPALSTANLRQRVFDKIGMKSGA